MRPPPPPEIEELAYERAEARRARDWPRADGLRAAIEQAGWKVIDAGASFTLEPAHPPDVEEGGVVRYGSSASVPSRLEEPAAGRASVLVVATDRPDDVSRAVAGLAAHAPEGTHVVLIADGPTDEQAAALGDPAALPPVAGEAPEVIRTSERLGAAAALAAGLRRASAPVVIWLDANVEPVDDVVSPLAAAFEDRSVAVAGAPGLRSGDLRHFHDAPAGDADAIGPDALAFRRDDARVAGALDERFRSRRHLAIWWSLVLRDSPGSIVAPVPRRAVAVELPLVRHQDRGAAPPAPDDARAGKRDFYRIIDRFGARSDLLLEPAARGTRRA